LLLIDNLGVYEEEGSVLILNARLQQHVLQVFSPAPHGVSLNNFDLEESVSRNEGSQLAQTLPAAASDSQDQRVALGLSEDPGYARDMLRGIEEKN